MTLLNHIGIWILLTLIWFINDFWEIIKKEQPITFNDITADLFISSLFWVIIEGFYWTIKIFFLN